jgi:hypothetical protein
MDMFCHRRLICNGVASWLLVAVFVGGARASADPKTILEQAIAALGGEKRLEELDRYYVRQNVKMGGARVLSEQWFDASEARLKQRGVIEQDGERFEVLRIINGDEGWVQIDKEKPRAMTKEELRGCSKSRDFLKR